MFRGCITWHQRDFTDHLVVAGLTEPLKYHLVLWRGYAFVRWRNCSGEKLYWGMISHSLSMKRLGVIPKRTRMSSALAPPYGAHMLANSMRRQVSVSPCVRVRLMPVAAALWL